MSFDSKIDYINPITVLGLSSKNSNFETNSIPINNCENFAITMHVSMPSSLNCTAKIQGSYDNFTWMDIKDTDTIVTAADDVLWTLSELRGLIYLRVKVTFISGSSLFIIMARGA